MFIHFLAGSLVFLFFGRILGLEITRIYLIIGAILGIFPDPMSYILSWSIKFNKWAHTHRDNFSHSIFLPMIVIVIALIFHSKLAIVSGVAMLTHPLLDLFGIGWGVKLFYPISNKTFKMFYKGKLITIWIQEEVDAEAEKFGDNDWVRNIYFKPNLVGASEWLSLAGFIILAFMH